jgi:hypothetical protein
MTRKRVRKNPKTLTGQPARLNQLIRKAALTLDDQGRIKVLADKAGLTSAGVRAAIRRGYFTPKQVLALHTVVEPKLLPAGPLCGQKLKR